MTSLPYIRLTLEASQEKKLHKHLRGVNQTLRSTLDTIHPIDIIFGAYNKLHRHHPLYLYTVQQQAIQNYVNSK